MIEKSYKSWGYYTVLYYDSEVKVKELIIEPGKALSMQKHLFRNEYWHVVKGKGYVKTKQENSETFEIIDLFKNKSITIFINSWHQLVNTGEENLHIIEIQYGDKCDELDIQRII